MFKYELNNIDIRVRHRRRHRRRLRIFRHLRRCPSVRPLPQEDAAPLEQARTVTYIHTYVHSYIHTFIALTSTVSEILGVQCKYLLNLENKINFSSMKSDIYIYVRAVCMYACMYVLSCTVWGTGRGGGDGGAFRDVGSGCRVGPVPTLRT